MWSTPYSGTHTTARLRGIQAPQQYEKGNEVPKAAGGTTRGGLHFKVSARTLCRQALGVGRLRIYTWKVSSHAIVTDKRLSVMKATSDLGITSV